MGRVLFVARELTPGGAAYLAVRHLRELEAVRQFDLLVTGPLSPSVVEDIPYSVSVHRLTVNNEAIRRGLLATREAIAELGHPCLTQTYDVVVGTSLFPDMLACASFALALASKKMIILLDEGLISPGLCPEMRAAMGNAVVEADQLLPVSRSLLEKLTSRFPLLCEIPAVVIPPPINAPCPDHPSPFLAASGENLLRIVTVCRLSPEKQLGKCLQVHRSLRDQGLEFHWHVIGEGVEREALEQGIVKYGMADRFHLEGWHTNPRPWMRHADLFVLCSRSEGCPMVIREALAEGTPVLSTEVNGAREMISDGITGMIVADTESQIAWAMRRLLTDSALRRRLRDNVASMPRSNPDQESRLLIDRFVGGRRRTSPYVTILIPTYNHAQCIERAIHSSLMQDYPALEVVVCDDASTDETGAIAIRWIHDPRFRYVHRPVNLGRVANYRLAVEHDASGQWVLVLDGDDYLTDPSFVTSAMRALFEHADANPLFVQSGQRVTYQRLTSSLLTDSLSFDIQPEIPADAVVMSGSEYLAFVFRTGFFTHLGTIFSRQAALQMGFYRNDISSADMDSLLRLALRGNIVIKKGIAGCWVQHGGNHSSNLPLDQVARNVTIFRKIAYEGAVAGSLAMLKIEKCLTRYEARVLVHLFGAATKKSGYDTAQFFQMIGIIIQVNPRVLLQPELVRVLWRYVRGWWSSLFRELGVLS